MNSLDSIFSHHTNNSDSEFNDNNWIRKSEEIIFNLRKSLELINGDGDITVKSDYDYNGDRLMYVEKLNVNGNTYLLVIHAAFTFNDYRQKFYRYEIAVYDNDSEIKQIGGGYGTTGIDVVSNKMIIGSINNYCRNKFVISKVIEELKKKYLN